MSGIMPPKKTGRRATVVMQMDVYVEVAETDSYHDMVRQAKEELRKRVFESKGFFPFASRAGNIHPDVEVDELKHHTLVDTERKW